MTKNNQVDMKVNLFYNYYQNASRQHELDLCLEKNRQVFDRVILVEGRPTFKELFDLTKEYPEDINCFCNSDIYFTPEAIQQIVGIASNECYALTRWDFKAGKLNFFNRVDSQDAWIFRGVVRPLRESNFTMGMWGCDNRLAHELKSAGYKLLNPSLSIVTVHVHESEERNHQRTVMNTVPPPYHQIKPHTL